jgi:hypothetical protein
MYEGAEQRQDRKADEVVMTMKMKTTTGFEYDVVAVDFERSEHFADVTHRNGTVASFEKSMIASIKES